MMWTGFNLVTLLPTVYIQIVIEAFLLLFKYWLVYYYYPTSQRYHFEEVVDLLPKFILTRNTNIWNREADVKLYIVAFSFFFPMTVVNSHG